jgi:hypothetical protein
MATTTPNYGWSVPTSSDYVAQGAVAIETLGDSVDSTLFTALGGAYPGLRLVKKQTIGTGVTSVTVTNAFSATYENYKILVSGGTGTSETAFMLTLGSANTGYSSVLNVVNYSTSAVTAIGYNNTTLFPDCGRVNPNGNFASFEVLSPFLTKNTRFSSIFENGVNAGNAVGIQTSTTSFTDFTIARTATATITGGTIYVYGYGTS